MPVNPHWIACVCSGAALCASAQQPQPASAPASAPASRAARATASLELRAEPLVELWFEVRARAVDREARPPAELAAAVAALRALDERLRSPLAYGPIEGLLAGCADGAVLEHAFAELPLSTRLPGAGEVELRAPALAAAAALRAAEAGWREREWPARARELGAARARLEREFLPKQAELFEFHQRWLELELAAPLAIPCYLVTRLPPPGAITQRGPDGRGLCFVAAPGAEGSQLFETVLHEATHALDIACEGDVFDQLRARLAAAGIAKTDRRLRDVPHALMFVQAAQSVRRVLAPQHLDYGERAGTYAKLGRAAELERELWPGVLDGQRSASDALDALVEALR